MKQLYEENQVNEKEEKESEDLEENQPEMMIKEGVQDESKFAPRKNYH